MSDGRSDAERISREIDAAEVHRLKPIMEPPRCPHCEQLERLLRKVSVDLGRTREALTMVLNELESGRLS